jgi:hypothetical protein
VVGCHGKGAILIGPVGRGGVVRVAVVEDIATQEVGYLPDEALGKELEFSVWVGYCSGHDGDAVLNFCQLGIEVFPAKAGEPSNRGSKEAEASAEFDREGWAQDIYVIWYGRILEIVSVMEVASVGLRWRRSGIGEWPEVEVRMRVFIGLRKHPSGAPMVANQLQRNCKSTGGMQAETLSKFPRRCVMPPKPSLPGSPLRRQVVALLCDSMSSGWRRLATTRDAKMGESGQPWLMLSSMGSRLCHVLSAHLQWTVQAFCRIGW